MNESVLDVRLRPIVGTTTRFVFSIGEVPSTVRSTFLAAINPFREVVLDGAGAEARDRLSALKTRDWSIADRGDVWSEGCTTGDHFLAAGEASSGVWWVWFETGGMVCTRKIVVISNVTSTSPRTESFEVPRAFHVYPKKTPNQALQPTAPSGRG
jgi:hypothetical protein